MHEPIHVPESRVLHDAQHAFRQSIKRQQTFFTAHAAYHLVFEELFFRHVQRIRVHQTAAADARPAHDQYITQQSHAHDAVTERRRHPQELEDIPVGLRKIATLPAPPRFEYEHPVALLREPHGRDAAAETRSYDDVVVIELRIGRPRSPFDCGPGARSGTGGGRFGPPGGGFLLGGSGHVTEVDRESCRSNGFGAVEKFGAKAT